MSVKSKLLKYLPYVYFAVFFLLINDGSARYYNLFLFAIASIFFLQLFLQIKYVDAVIGLVMLLLSGWFSLAYLSDFHKITSFTSQTWSFILVGGVIVISNFIMSGLLFRNAVKRLA